MYCSASLRKRSSVSLIKTRGNTPLASAASTSFCALPTRFSTASAVSVPLATSLALSSSRLDVLMKR